MKKVNCFFWTTLLFTALLQSSFAQNKEITVTGKVTDTSGTAIPEAMVVLGSGLTNINTDTVYTGNNGTFNTKVTVNQNAYGIMYRISKSGYNTKSGYGLIDTAGNTVDLGTVVLDHGITQDITVTGRVIDSVTGDPIENALVRLSTSLSIIDTLYDSTYTGSDGKFSHVMNPDMWIQPRLLYLVTKDGYLPNYGIEKIQGTTVALGDIKLQKESVSITHPTTAVKSSNGRGWIALYSLRGQLLYSGKEVPIHHLVSRSVINKAQPIIEVHKRGNKKIYRKNILLRE